MTSNWKQCVWKNLNDGKDTGLIKVNVILTILLAIKCNICTHHTMHSFSSLSPRRLTPLAPTCAYVKREGAALLDLAKSIYYLSNRALSLCLQSLL